MNFAGSRVFSCRGNFHGPAEAFLFWERPECGGRLCCSSLFLAPGELRWSGMIGIYISCECAAREAVGFSSRYNVFN